MTIPEHVLEEFGNHPEVALREWAAFLEEELRIEQWEHYCTRRRLRSREIELERMRDNLYKHRVEKLVEEERQEAGGRLVVATHGESRTRFLYTCGKCSARVQCDDDDAARKAGWLIEQGQPQLCPLCAAETRR